MRFYFPSAWRTSVNISGSVDLLEINSLSFYCQKTSLFDCILEGYFFLNIDTGVTVVFIFFQCFQCFSLFSVIHCFWRVFSSHSNHCFVRDMPFIFPCLKHVLFLFVFQPNVFRYHCLCIWCLLKKHLKYQVLFLLATWSLSHTCSKRMIQELVCPTCVAEGLVYTQDLGLPYFGSLLS